jgi:hypothetical protein
MFHTTLAHDTITNRIAFYHASCYSPSLSTWCAAIDAGHFTTWPGLTSAAVKKYPPQSMDMHQGHLDQARMNTRMTQARSPAIPIADEHNQQPTSEAPADTDTAPPEPPSIRTHHIYAHCHAATGMIYTDPTGRFLTPSVSGNQYMLVVYEYDGIYNHSEPMIDRTGPSIIAAYTKAVKLFESRGFKPLLQRLDNESSTALQAVLDDCGPTPLSSSQRRRTCNPHVQKSLHSRAMLNESRFSSQPLVQIASPMLTHLEPPPALMHQPSTLCPSPHARRLRLQQNAPRPTGHKSTHPRKT